jgi:LAGLIDADG DNA endonuclease family
MTSNKTTKQIARSFTDKAFALYPEWNQPLVLPKPIYSSKLTNVNLSNKQMSQVPIDEITKSVLCGTILGDSSFRIDKGYANARFQSRHSTKQFTWFTWKSLVILKDFTNRDAVLFQEQDGYQLSTTCFKSGFYPDQAQAKLELNRYAENILGKLKIASIADPKLTVLHKLICVNNRKKIQRFWLNHMNNYFLMTVWLDDGSLMNRRQGLISFNSAPIDEQNVFREYLLSVWGIETSLQDTGKIMTNGQANCRISIKNIESLLTLLRLVAPVIPVHEMLYKVYFVPENNPSLLQRWRTELKGLVRPEFAAYVDNYYDSV